jgi:hypothetical protein
VQNNNDNGEYTFVIKRNKNKMEVYQSNLEFGLGTGMAVYRNLRENYEFRLRYDEAGRFFIKEMELKRNYRETISQDDKDTVIKIKRNGWLRRNISLTGLYYHLSRYGNESRNILYEFLVLTL